MSEQHATPPATAGDRSLANRIAAHRSWARTADRAARTAPARTASDARFEAEVDPEGVMTPEARRLAADAARRAHYLDMARRSVDVRRRKAAASELRRMAAEIEAEGDGAA